MLHNFLFSQFYITVLYFLRVVFLFEIEYN